VWTWKRVAAREDLDFNEFFEEFSHIGSLLEVPCNKTMDSI